MRADDSPTPASLPAICALTFLNSLGSGLLWSGIYFVTKEAYAWSERDNFALALIQTAVYAVAAFMSGRLVAGLRGRLSTRGLVSALMVLQAVGGALAFFGPMGVIACAICSSAASAMLWPIMEAYLSAGRHGHRLRRAIGVFNVSWMSAVGAALLVMAPMLAAGAAKLSLVLFIPISLVSIALLPWLAQDPPPHGAGAHDADAPTAAPREAGAASIAASHMPVHRHRPSNDRALRDATRVLLPVGYILIGALGPAIPFLLDGLRLEEGWRTPVTAIWMATRLVAVLFLMRFTFWHGRAWAIGLGFALAAGGFATIALAPSLSVMIAGLVAFGVGQAVVYYAALYYAMAVGGAEVHAGSIFEALIGLGYGVGPILGLALGTGTEYVWGVLSISVAITAATFARVALARLSR